MSAVLIPIMGMMIPIVIVPAAIYAKHAARRRELDHAERIRAMELGLSPNAGRAGTWPAALAASAIGVMVPAVSFGTALAAVLEADAGQEAWVAAGVVSALALVVAAAVLIQAQAAASRIIPAQLDAFAKPPAYDPDAFDVAGSRG